MNWPASPLDYLEPPTRIRPTGPRRCASRTRAGSSARGAHTSRAILADASAIMCADCSASYDEFTNNEAIDCTGIVTGTPFSSQKYVKSTISILQI